jgi:hypothetical protein
MKTILKAGAALAFLAVAAYGTQSNADEPTSATNAPAADTGDLLQADSDKPKGEAELDGLSGGAAIEADELSQIAIPTAVNNSTDNDIELSGDNSQLNTGLTEGIQANTGGINSFMQNTGNNVNFQNQTIVQVIMGE